MKNILLILILLAAGVFTNRASAQAVILRADTVEVPCISTDTFLVPVYLDNFNNVAGLQFTLKWDTAHLDYAFVTMMHPQFAGAGFDTTAATIALGKLTFAWTDLAGLNLPQGTVLFKVAFSRIGGPQTPVAFVNDTLGTPIFVFDNVGNELPYETHNGAVKPLDNAGPSITCPASVITGASGPIPIPNIAPTLSDNCGTPAAGWTSAGATVANFPNDPDASGATFNLGLSTVTYKTTDAGGNTATCSFDILIEFSVTTNDLTIIANPNNLASCGETVSIDVLAFNFDSIAGLQFTMDWLPNILDFVSISNPNAALNIGPAQFNTDSTGVGFFTFVWNSANINGGSVPDGDVLFTLTYNVLGSGMVNFVNVPTQMFAFLGPSFDETPLITFGATVSVIDTTSPTITCPANITVQALGTTPVQGIAPVNVDDNCAAPQIGWSVTGDTNGNFPNDGDASGGLFNLGNSTVTYLATDAGGNTASCSFDVTVEFSNNTTDLTIVANSANAACGGSFSVDYTAFNFTTVAGVQFTVTWDATLYQFASVSNFNLPVGIGITNFNLDSAGVGYLTFVWNSGTPAGSSVNDGEILFSLNFDLLSNTASSIQFADLPTSRFAFEGGTFDEITMVTIDGLVSITDNIPPSITCPSSVQVDAPTGQLFATVNGLEPTSLTDNCGILTDSSYTQSGATTNSGSGWANGNYNAGTTTVVYTVTDGNGNDASCSFQVVVDAGTPVILQLDTVDLGCQGAPTEVTVHLTVQNFTDIIGLQFGVSWDTSVIKLVPPVTLDYLLGGPNPIFVNAAGTLTFFGAEPSWPDVPNGEAILTMTFTVEDLAALASTGITFFAPFDALDPNFQSIPVQTINGGFAFTLDNVPPVMTCPADTVIDAAPLSCIANYTPVQPAATDACGAVDSIAVAFSPAGGVFMADQPTTVTYTATDDAGNSTSCSYTVTVIPHTPPQVAGCPASPILADANTLCQANVNWTPPSFQAACGLGLDTVINDYDPGGLFTLGSTLVNYTATDLFGNVTTCSFEVVVRDVTLPTVICPTDTTIIPSSGCSAVVNYTITATDFCDSDLEFICSDTSGTLFSGVSPVICAIIDDAGNVANCAFVVTIADTLAPVFPNGCPANINVASANGNCGVNPNWIPPTVSDNCTQPIVPMASQGPGSFFTVQNSPHTVTYTATDNQGNTATCTFTVTVADTTRPSLTNCPSIPIVKVLPIDSCMVTLNWTAPSAADNCSGVTLISNLSPGLFPTGDTVVVYTATDASGNTRTCSFLVSVKDVIPPSFIDCPTQPYVFSNGNPCGNIVDFTLPTGMDNCTPQNELVYSGSFDTLTMFPIGTTSFPYTVTDASGLFDICNITITIMGQVPGFSNIPGPFTITKCDSVVTWNSPLPIGFCPPVTIDSSHASGTVFPFGTTIVTYMALDTFGNSATATFTITVSENVPPVFNCPISPILVNVGGGIIQDSSDFLQSATAVPGCDGVELTFNQPSATDNCVTPTVTLLPPGPASGSVFPQAITTLQFQATDSSGNVATCFVHLEVVGLPELRPVVNPNPGCVGDTLTITAADIAEATYTWTGPVTSSTNVVLINGLSAQNEGLYVVSANVNGCLVGPDSITVYLTTPPMAENDLNYTINPGETLTFSSVLTNDILVPVFDFEICNNDQIPGLTMNTTDGTFTYTAGDEPGMVSFLYNVCSKTCGIFDQAAVTITINDTECSFIPNIITPNGDDDNDWLEIRCLDTGLFRENSLVVYSQWGQKVYEASPYLNNAVDGWRGTLDGEPGKDLPDGVYFYIFRPGPNVPPLKGFVEVFR